MLEQTVGKPGDYAYWVEADGSLADRVVTAVKLQTDRTRALREAMGSVRRGGTISLSGVYTGPVQLFPLGDLFDLQVQLRMGQANVRRWVDDLLPLLGDDDPLGTADLVTHRAPLEQAPELYRTFQRKEDGCVKVVLRP